MEGPGGAGGVECVSRYSICVVYLDTHGQLPISTSVTWGSCKTIAVLKKHPAIRSELRLLADRPRPESISNVSYYIRFRWRTNREYHIASHHFVYSSFHTAHTSLTVANWLL